MTIDDQIRDEKLQYDINREAAKISALSNKIGKYGYLNGEEILPSNQKQIVEQAKFTYSSLGKAFEKHVKTIEDQREKQVGALKVLNLKDHPKSIKGISPKGNKTGGIKDELGKIKGYENEAIRDNLFYDLSQQPFDFTTFKTIRSLGDDICNKRVNKAGLYKGREFVINAFKSRLFPLKSTTGTGLEILTPKQMLQRLPIALVQGKVGNNSESLLNEISQIIYSLYQSKEITKKVYNNITKSMQL